MEYELKFLSMLGYKAVLVGGAKWTILDNNDKAVGFIQLKQLNSKKQKKDLKTVLCYVMKIKSDTICYNGTRRLDEKIEDFYYEFDVKRDNETDHVNMSIGKSPFLTMWSKEYGFMDFNLAYNNLYFNYSSTTPNFYIEEIVSFEWNKLNENQTDYSKEFSYTINYCNRKNSDPENKRASSKLILFGYNSFTMNQNQLDVEEFYWRKKRLLEKKENRVEGTVEEAIEKHKMGINSFSHFRFLLNKILPFKQEVMETMLEDCELGEKELRLFFPDLIEKREKDQKKKAKI